MAWWLWGLLVWCALSVVAGVLLGAVARSAREQAYAGRDTDFSSLPDAA